MARKTPPSPLLTVPLAALVALYIRLVHRTVRWEVIGEEHHWRLIDEGAPFVCAFWHARLLMMPVLQRMQGRGFVMMISDHRDGEVIARVLGHFRIDTRRGSAADPRKPEKSKGGASALKGLLSAMANGQNVGITPDGPRGPAQVAQPGVAQLARLSDAPVLPVSYSVARGKRAASWDRFLLPLPLPFSRGVFIYGEPVRVEGRGASAVEAGRAAIERHLNRITAEADHRMGATGAAGAAVAAPPVTREAGGR